MVEAPTDRKGASSVAPLSLLIVILSGPALGLFAGLKNTPDLWARLRGNCRSSSIDDWRTNHVVFSLAGMSLMAEALAIYAIIAAVTKGNWRPGMVICAGISGLGVACSAVHLPAWIAAGKSWLRTKCTRPAWLALDLTVICMAVPSVTAFELASR